MKAGLSFRGWFLQGPSRNWLNAWVDQAIRKKESRDGRISNMVGGIETLYTFCLRLGETSFDFCLAMC